MGRFTLTREFYIPAEGREIDTEGTDATVYTWERVGEGKIDYLAKGFHGKAAKPDFHYRFSTAERRAEYIAQYLDGRRQRAERISTYRREKAQPHSLKVGDLLSSSWGYDQTNIEFYEVTRVIGAHTVEIREVAQERTQTGFMQGDCSPVRGRYLSPPTRHRASADGSVKVRDFGVWARPWDGRREHWTAYA